MIEEVAIKAAIGQNPSDAGVIMQQVALAAWNNQEVASYASKLIPPLDNPGVKLTHQILKTFRRPMSIASRLWAGYVDR